MEELIKEIDIIANTMVEPGLSGGNRIFIELAKRLAETGVVVNVFTSTEGKKICEKNGLKKANYFVWQIPKFFLKKVEKLTRFEIFLLYLIGLGRGLLNYRHFLKGKIGKRIIWTTSDYWPDSLIGITAKFINRGNFWIGSLFLFAPNPLVGFREKGKLTFPSLKNSLFYLTQQPILNITKRLADLIFVTSHPDKDKFIQAGKDPRKIIVVRGGVDTRWADRYLAGSQNEEKEYEACFVGRFHPQKGVLELIDIWNEVCKFDKKAKLVMIGDGELKEAVNKKIQEKGLEKNIILKGFLGDGEDKFAIFKKSRIVLHPAVYDSGGMAAAEAMAWGLPGVSFDLKALKSYYPYGVLKAKLGDNKDFADLILKLLHDQKLYYNTSTQARRLILQEWDWREKATDIYKMIFGADRIK